jgi:hypothetical protein
MVTHIKHGISRKVKITDLGKLKRHLGFDYKVACDERGHDICSSMSDYHNSTVRDSRHKCQVPSRCFQLLALLSHRHCVPLPTTRLF